LNIQICFADLNGSSPRISNFDPIIVLIIQGTSNFIGLGWAGPGLVPGTGNFAEKGWILGIGKTIN
jgi:hypothetical protein